MALPCDEERLARGAHGLEPRKHDAAFRRVDAGDHLEPPFGDDLAQREFELAPTSAGSEWWTVPVEANSAVAFNPSLAGGAKIEDTYLVGDGSPRSHRARIIVLFSNSFMIAARRSSARMSVSPKMIAL